MLNSHVCFENSGPDRGEKAQLKLSLTGRLQINDIRYSLSKEGEWI